MNIIKLILEGSNFRNISIDQAFLKNKDLLPVTEIKIDNVTIGLSKPYYSKIRKDKAFVGYIQKDNNIYARTFFLSKSQGVYRVLAAYKSEIIEGIEKPRWHYKGWSEESITLPILVQKSLAQLVKQQAVFKEDKGELFYGLSRNMNQKNDFEQVVNQNSITLNIDLNFNNKTKVNPTELIIKDINKAPDLTNIQNNWTCANTLIENVEVFTFFSKDKSIEYAFATDKKDFSWLMAVQPTKSEITKYGVFTDWVKGGDFTTPPFEYLTDTQDRKIDQTGGYGNIKIRKGHYVDMYLNYISKIDIVREFNESLGLNIGYK